MNRTRFLLTILLLKSAILLANCAIPRALPGSAIGTHLPEPAAPTETPFPALPTPQLGLAENPLILALPPSATAPEQLAAAKEIASQLTTRTGYTVVTIVPDSYTALVDALESGNAHIVLLDPYAYELAYRRELVRAAFAVLKEGEGTYGAQFLATRKGGFESFFDANSEQNTADAKTALAQFADKKPCWSDETSPSGYVIPLGVLHENEIVTKPPAFVEGHPTVVRSLYASGICDFGATYIDARKFPSLEDEFPDLIEQVIVVWQIPPIIPHEVLAFSTDMPQAMHDLLASLILPIMQTDAGRQAFKVAFDIEEVLPVNDGYYEEFRIYVDESGVDISTLVK